MAGRPSRQRNSNAPHRAGGPSEIAPGVFVGSWRDAVEFEGTRFCVREEAPDDRFPATHIPIYDGSHDRAIVDQLDRLAESVSRARARGERVLVYCGHGVRRSPLAAAWYLHRAEQLSLAEAYARIEAVRPEVERARDWVGNPENLEET